MGNEDGDGFSQSDEKLVVVVFQKKKNERKVYYNFVRLQLVILIYHPKIILHKYIVIFIIIIPFKNEYNIYLLFFVFKQYNTNDFFQTK